MRRIGTIPSSLTGLVLVALLPLQLVAHCGAVPGPAGHAEGHHPHPSDAAAADPHGAVRGSDDGGACTLEAPTFTSRRDSGPGGLGPAASIPGSEAHAVAASGASPRVSGRPLPGCPPAAPLRI
jgi:hypothetical protein